MPQPIRERVDQGTWAAIQRSRFVPATFHSYPCLVMIEPVTPEGGALWTPYHGEPYDPAVYKLVEGGWDHEHCSVCWAKISDGDRYWKSDGPDEIELCPDCHPLVQAELSS
jgi:hypothetical protein